ncbi:hypothetical protein Pmani_022077 [Petrolisthes manimaculis]|uniref:Ig-like domain-containing protein n=1 Tax=Petrolisthes manimaculis TaxID=1843537 RepID=A0AAE1PEJ2_9EUCA|nr:hypothetical protein Pmani_022077 [Petrolisthes manimaculis]
MPGSTMLYQIPEPRVRVVEEGGRDVEEKHYNSGSRIELQCVIDRVPFPPRPVTWRRGNTVLAFNTSRGGISVKGDEAAGFLASRLYVTNAAPSDSGRYSCCYHTFASDTVTVHVIAGCVQIVPVCENSAGLQHDAPPESSGASSSSSSRSIGRSKGPPVLLWVVVTCLTICITTPHPHPP